jgi:hypothetical protein
VNGAKSGLAIGELSSIAAMHADGAKLRLGNPQRKIEGIRRGFTLREVYEVS